MNLETAAPCRHAGVAPDQIINQVIKVISQLAADPKYLGSNGLSVAEYTSALPAAIERMRGSSSAQNADRRQFLINMFNSMLDRSLIQNFAEPDYGSDTVYRLSIKDVGDIAIIQKGCPDGAHSSTTWSVPEWAVESYLWWLCPSMAHEPGAHIAKGVGRLKQKFMRSLNESASERFVDGVIFHNEMCGTSNRLCPKKDRSVSIGGLDVPPPCLYAFPKADADAKEWNWAASRELAFPRTLFALFGISQAELPYYGGQIGFQKKGSEIRTNISSQYGLGKSTTLRT
ncbi:hypothetical protein [Paraburkholderia fungorum]|uniref:hypothetical protein n=1 Tax=Paraburkholderia fungorum TaxID=134537 RepID=UPI00248D85C5|nr:hypothetical protein [Paraburkholderia fungorum]